VSTRKAPERIQVKQKHWCWQPSLHIRCGNYSHTASFGSYLRPGVVVRPGVVDFSVTSVVVRPGVVDFSVNSPVVSNPVVVSTPEVVVVVPTTDVVVVLTPGAVVVPTPGLVVVVTPVVFVVTTVVVSAGQRQQTSITPV
jgi:hypothetical protein